MKTFFKKSVALAMVLLMLITSIPVMNFAGIDLGLTAQAATITSYSKGDIIEFGWYPQSKVTDSAIITALNNEASAWENWTSYGYYSGTGSVGTMKQGDWMRYTDVIYDGNKYRGVKFTQYRKYLTWDDSPYTYQDDNGYSPNTVYWFKFEPIDWRVLDPAIGLVLCETIIDSQPYSNTIYCNAGGTYGYFNDSSYKNYASDYETSSIRDWLNADFYYTAFSSSQQKIIKSTTLNNDSYYTSVGTLGYEKLDSNETKDKIFLLSYNEVRNNKFGFDSSSSVYDPARFAQGSDYAQSQGLYVCKNLGSPYNNNANWLLRSPGGSSDSCCCVFSYGNSNDYYSVYRTDLGVRPAMKLNLSAEIINPDNPNDPDEPVNPDNPVDPNNPDTPDSDDDPPISDSEVIIKFVKDTYEVYVGEKITVSGNVTCSSGINDLELEWENHYPEGVKVEKPGSQVTVSENELIFSTYIHGLKAGTYFVNLCDNNTTEFNSVKIVVLDYYSDDEEDDDNHNNGFDYTIYDTKPEISGNFANLTYDNDFWKWNTKKFKVSGIINNVLSKYDTWNAQKEYEKKKYYNSKGINELNNLFITLKSPDTKKLYFKGEKSEITFPLGRNIGAGCSDTYECDIYVDRDYYPPNGSEVVTLECILDGYLDGDKISGVYSSFQVRITNESYKWGKQSLKELLAELKALVKPYESYYRSNVGRLYGGTGLFEDITAVEMSYSIGAMASSLELSETVYDIIYYFSSMKLSPTKEYGKMFMDQLSEDSDKKVKEIIGAMESRLLSNTYFDGFIEWCRVNYGVDAGAYGKYSNHCPTDIIVTAEDGKVVLKIIEDKIVVCDSNILANVFESKKTFYLPTGIDHEINIIATNNGTMDYSVEIITEYGEKRIIQYNNVSLTKNKSYTATAPANISSETDVFNLVSESGNIIKADTEQIAHTFDDQDATCKDCGYDRTEGCSCQCHKTGFFAKIIWKIKIFFQKLFKKNQVCSCGIYHY